MSETILRPVARRAQVFKSLVERGWELAARLARPWHYCRCCGDRLVYSRLDGACPACHSWAKTIFLAHESARRRRFFRGA